MHFNTGAANNGDTAALESRLLYPKRQQQCLQFFCYNSGAASDALKIYLREYDSANPNGTLRLVATVNGDRRSPKFHRMIPIVISEGVKSPVSRQLLLRRCGNCTT